jgi:cation diffusion facilitator CzcD-associated flavoprotein CzcO
MKPTDVIVIGGGQAGLAVGRALQKASLQRFSYPLTRFLTLTAAPDGLGSLRALTSMKTAVCCDSRWSPMFNASRQTLCKVL